MWRGVYGEMSPYWTRISEAGFDIPAVLFLVDPILAWPMVDANSVPFVKRVVQLRKTRKKCYVCGRHVTVHEMHEVCGMCHEWNECGVRVATVNTL